MCKYLNPFTEEIKTKEEFERDYDFRDESDAHISLDEWMSCLEEVKNVI